MNQIRKLIYQNKFCLVRNIMYEEYHDEKEYMVPLFMQMSYIAYMKNDTYRYNLKYSKMLQHKYDDSSDSDSELDD